MARNRTPSNILDLRGAYKKHPERRRKQEPVPRLGIGEPPSHLTEQQAATWHSVVEIMPAGVLGNSDRIALEVLVCLLVESRNDYKNFTGARMSQLVSLLGRFGLTPSDRTRISVPSGRGSNEFNDL